MLIPINFVSPVWKLHNPYFHIYRCFFYNLARSYDACLGATYAKNDLLRRSHISFLHAHMNHFSKVAVNVVKLFFLFYIHEFILSLIQTSEFGGLCPRQLIDLNISNFEFWMFVLIFSTTTACRKQQQIFDIQNSTLPKRWAAKDIWLKSSKKVPNLYPDHLFCRWIVLRIVIWQFFWRFEPKHTT